MRQASAAVSAVLMLVSGPATATESEFVIGPDPVIDATFNGNSARMLVRGVGGSVPVLNRASAERFGVRPALIRSGNYFRVGPVRVNGRNGVARYIINGQAQRRRIGWFEREVAPGYDGLLGPMAIPAPVVTFRLRAPAAGEQTVSLALSTFGYLGAGVVLRRQPLTIMQFDPASPTTIANALMGSELAGSLRGHFIDEVRPRLIAFGVSRPVRTLQFGTPLQFEALRISRTEVRTQDWGNASAIPETAPDPDEIVVNALDRNDRRPRFLIVGADALQNCSSVTFDKPSRRIRLRCLPG
jgi:hypothetical protein